MDHTYYRKVTVGKTVAELSPGRKRKRQEGRGTREKQRHRINIGDVFQQWQAFMEEMHLANTDRFSAGQVNY